MTKLVVAFHNFVNAHKIRKKNFIIFHTPVRLLAALVMVCSRVALSNVLAFYCSVNSNELVHVSGRAPRSMAVKRATELLVSACLFLHR